MKKIFTLFAVAILALCANAQALYLTGSSSVSGDEGGLPTSWDATNPVEFDVVDGNYVLTINGLEQFKISTKKGSWDEFNAGCYGCNYGDEAGVAVALEAGNLSNIYVPWAGNWTVTVAGNLSTITLTTTTPNPGVKTVEIYFRGTMNGWNAQPEWMLENVAGTSLYKFVCDDYESISLSDSFKIADSSWGRYNIGYDAKIQFETEIFLHGGNNPGNMTLSEDWNGVCWFDLETYQAAFSNNKDYVPAFAEEKLGISDIVAEEQPAEYYNLQGVKTTPTAGGIYIERRGDKASIIRK